MLKKYFFGDYQAFLNHFRPCECMFMLIKINNKNISIWFELPTLHSSFFIGISCYYIFSHGRLGSSTKFEKYSCRFGKLRNLQTVFLNLEFNKEIRQVWDQTWASNSSEDCCLEITQNSANIHYWASTQLRYHRLDTCLEFVPPFAEVFFGMLCSQS